MPSSTAGADRSGAIRGEARARLAQLRQRRLSQRRQAQTAAAEAAILPSGEAAVSPGAALPARPVPTPVSEIHAPSSAGRVVVTAEPVPPPSPMSPSQGSEDCSISAAQAVLRARSPELAPPAMPIGPQPGPRAAARPAPKSVGSDPSDAEPNLPVATPSPLAAAAAPVEAPPQQTPDAPRSDLFDLPGAGTGLVWMLEECGIRSLADLAAADRITLSEKLGLVAQILDIGYWIDFAAGKKSAVS